jgi:hypothetical protein
MSELTPETAQPAPEAQPTVVPEEVMPDVFNQMYAETTGEAFPLGTETDDVDTEDYGDAVTPDEDTQTRMFDLQSRLDQANAYIQGQSANQQQAPQTQPKTVEEQVREKNPDLSEAQAKWLTDNVQAIAGPMLQNLSGQVQYLSDRQQKTDQKSTVDDFDAHLDGLMDNHSIADPWTRKVMRHAIVNDGLERYGNKFSKDLATNEFIQLNNQRLERAHDQSTAYVNDKQRIEGETPAATGPVSISTAVQGVRDRIRDPRNKKMDFRGDTFNETVAGYLEAIETGADNALGGSRG